MLARRLLGHAPILVALSAFGCADSSTGHDDLGGDSGASTASDSGTSHSGDSGASMAGDSGTGAQPDSGSDGGGKSDGGTGGLFDSCSLAGGCLADCSPPASDPIATGNAAFDLYDGCFLAGMKVAGMTE